MSLAERSETDFPFVIGEFKYEVQRVDAVGFRPSGATCL
jgi:hypothetical protein